MHHLQPDLVIINYGTNESGYAAFIDQSYGKELTEVVRRIRAALPETSILLMSPMDRGVRESSGRDRHDADDPAAGDDSAAGGDGNRLRFL